MKAMQSATTLALPRQTRYSSIRLHSAEGTNPVKTYLVEAGVCRVVRVTAQTDRVVPGAFRRLNGSGSRQAKRTTSLGGRCHRYKVTMPSLPLSGRISCSLRTTPSFIKGGGIRRQLKPMFEWPLVDLQSLLTITLCRPQLPSLPNTAFSRLA